MNGENYYWSKISPDYPEHVDFLTADTTCYSPYTGTDLHEYSTTLFTDHILDVIDEHPMETSSLFLYLPFQAVHDPFSDRAKFLKGIPDEYLSEDVLHSIHQKIEGPRQQEYYKSLNLLDSAVGSIVDKLEEKGMMDNSYVIFMSDNGGQSCVAYICVMCLFLYYFFSRPPSCIDFSSLSHRTFNDTIPMSRLPLRRWKEFTLPRRQGHTL